MSDAVMQVQWDTFMQLLREPVDAGWRLERAVRRLARRGTLKDCRQRFRVWRKSKRFRARRKVIGRWWQESISSRFRVNENGFLVAYPNRAHGGREVVVGIIDDPIKVAP